MEIPGITRRTRKTNISINDLALPAIKNKGQTAQVRFDRSEITQSSGAGEMIQT